MSNHQSQKSFSSVLKPLQHPLFRALWIASLVSNVGSWMQEIGEQWLMTSLTTSPTLIGFLETALTMPLFLLSLPGGALADIVDRRRVLIITQTWLTLFAFIMSILTITNMMTPLLLLFIVFVMGAGAAINGPAWQAIIPELVPRDDLPSAIAIGSVGFNVARAVGPAIGGFIIAASGPWAVFFFNGVSFLGVIVVLYKWKREHHESVLPTERALGAIRAGIRYVRHAPLIQAVLVRTIIFIVCASAMWATLPFIARHQMNVSSLLFSLFIAAFGIGAVVGAIIMARLRQKFSTDSIVRGATILFALLLLTLALVRIYPLLLCAMFAGGIAWMMLMSSLNTSAQLALPHWVRARAMAIYLMVFFGGFALGAAIWGTLTTHAGVSVALTIASSGTAAGAFISKKYNLVADTTLDLRPSMHWDAPVFVIEPRPDHGPVLITVEYHVDKENVQQFTKAIHALGKIRRRDGAVQWGIFADVSDPRRFIEQFVVESWLEHMRQHERVTVADREMEERVHAFHTGPNPPAVAHYIYSDEV